MFKIKNIKFFGISVPFKKKVSTNWSERLGTTYFIIELTTSNNNVGYGEVVCLFEPKIIENVLDRMIDQIKEIDLREINKMYQRAVYDGSWMRTGELNDLGALCWAGIETAVYNALSKDLNISLVEFFGGILNDKFSLAVNIDYSKPAIIKKNINRLIKNGYKNLFIKVAKSTNSLKSDLQLLNIVADFTKNKIGIHIDANGAWTIQTAIKALQSLKRSNINVKCIEQPIYVLESLKRLKKVSSFPIAIDENINNIQKIIRYLSSNVGDIFVVDIFKCGGLRNLFFSCKLLENSGIQAICKAHGNPGISFLTSLSIISCTNSSAISSLQQIYEYDSDTSYLEWKPIIRNGYLQISKKDLEFKLNKKKITQYRERYRSGERYFIYSNKKNKTFPKFPKY